MLGLKIAATGIIVMLVSACVVRAVGRWPGAAVGLPLLVCFFGGAALVGVLMMVWG